MLSVCEIQDLTKDRIRINIRFRTGFFFKDRFNLKNPGGFFNKTSRYSSVLKNLGFGEP